MHFNGNFFCNFSICTEITYFAFKSYFNYMYHFCFKVLFAFILSALFLTAFSQPLRIKSLKDICNPDTVAIGRPAIDLNATDIHGVPVSLETFKGRYIVVQVWSSTMQSCLREMSAWKKVKDDLKNLPITFIGVSVDKNISDWQLYYGQHNLLGIELHGESLKPPISYYLLHVKNKNGHNVLSFTLPQYILINTNGIILDPHMQLHPTDTTNFRHFLRNLPRPKS